MPVQTPAASRSLKLDNIKGFLIILVVLGHFVYAYREQGVSEYIFKIIYFFHMPAFVLVSGYLSGVKDHLSARPYLKLIISYMIINSMMMFYKHVITGASIQFLSPYYSCWYILALIVWRLLLQALSKYDLTVVLVISWILAIAVGFQDGINNILAMARTVAFFPFFLTGYMMKTGNVIRIFDRISVKVLGLLAAAVSAACMLYLISDYDFTTKNLIMSAYRDLMDPVKRLIIFCIALAVIFALYALLPERHIPLLTKWGKNSLTIYLFHRFFPLIFTHFFPVSGYTDRLAVYTVVLSFIMLVILGSDTANDLYNRFLNMLINGLTGDRTSPSSRRIRYTVLIIFAALILYVFLDPIILPQAG